MKLYTHSALFLILMSSTDIISANEYKIGFGSCLDQRIPQPIWSAIKDDDIDSFIFLGDNVYGDQPSGKLDTVIDAYQEQKEVLPKWLDKITIYPTWDDHDFGSNDGGGSYIYKKESQKIYLDFWKVPVNDQRRKQEGIYFNRMVEVEGLSIHLIMLDTRYFRSDLIDLKGPYPSFEKDNSNEATILGSDQWQWLEDTITKKADAIMLVSSIQILATNHGYEKWELFPKERERLMAIIDKLETPLLIVSGDRHKGAFYKKDNIYEITSSSLNKPIAPMKLAIQPKETDPLMIGGTFDKENYGTITINSDKRTITVSLKDIKGKIINRSVISL